MAEALTPIVECFFLCNRDVKSTCGQAEVVPQAPKEKRFFQFIEKVDIAVVASLIVLLLESNIFECHCQEIPFSFDQQSFICYHHKAPSRA